MKYVKILSLISEMSQEDLTVRQTVILRMLLEAVTEYHDEINSAANEVDKLKGRETNI